MASAPKRKKYEQEVQNENNESAAVNQFTRSQKQLQESDWKCRCFICGKVCDLKHRSEWSEVTGSINENSKMYRQVLEKAQEYRDMELFNRVLSTNGDLVAVEARYHRKKNCLAKKYSKYQKTELAKSPEDKNDPLVKACATVKQYFMHQIEQENQGIEFSVLKSKLTDILSEDKENIECPDPRRIKRVLSAIWPNIKFIPRPGLSDLVCSSNLTLEAALAKCISLERSVDDIKEQEECAQLFDSFIDENADERVTLNEAVNILRTRILKMTGLNKEYFSSKEVTLPKQKEFLDPLLLEFVYGLFGDRDDDDRERKVVSVSSDITYLVNPSIQTPKHLGLTNFLHHNYAKKNLIDDLNKHGYTLPYHEVRTFLTSAATYMITEQQKTPSGAVVPTCLPRNNDDRLLISVADNWDHNECTLSGKGSTHAMTSILVSTSHGTNSSPRFEPSRIPRVQERSLNTSSLPGGGLAHTLVYKKPAERPSPRLNPPVELDELVVLHFSLPLMNRPNQTGSAIIFLGCTLCFQRIHFFRLYYLHNSSP